MNVKFSFRQSNLKSFKNDDFLHVKDEDSCGYSHKLMAVYDVVGISKFPEHPQPNSSCLRINLSPLISDVYDKRDDLQTSRTLVKLYHMSSDNAGKFLFQGITRRDIYERNQEI